MTDYFDGEGRPTRIPGPRINPVGEKPWPWGPTVWIKDIGEYTVMCYLDDRSKFGLASEGHGQELFAVWVGDQQVDTTWESLDEALVDAVRFKYEGRRGSSGPRATEYFLKMIQQEG